LHQPQIPQPSFDDYAVGFESKSAVALRPTAFNFSGEAAMRIRDAGTKVIGQHIGDGHNGFDDEEPYSGDGSGAGWDTYRDDDEEGDGCGGGEVNGYCGEDGGDSEWKSQVNFDSDGNGIGCGIGYGFGYRNGGPDA